MHSIHGRRVDSFDPSRASMKSQKHSIARGGSVVVVGRLVGMVFSFFLFLVLARHSPVEAGVFRTVMTYIVIAEFLGMLGLHRWLATEIAPPGAARWPLFLATGAFTLLVSIFLTLGYLVIASLGFYSDYLSTSLMIGALAVIPSGIFAVVQSALVGIGLSQSMGRLNVFESVVRCSIALAFVTSGLPVAAIIWVFVGTRWVVACVGLWEVAHVLRADRWAPDLQVTKRVARAAPQFAWIVLGFMLLRNAGLLLLPALASEVETAVYTVTYQLFDLLLLIPSVLALASNNHFVNKADTSRAALNRAAIQLLSITALAFFPFLAIVAGFSSNILAMLYGDRYLAAAPSLMWLMVAAGLTIVDQVLSQVMVARRSYRRDLVSNTVGGSVAVLLSVALAASLGATGAAFALTTAVLAMVGIRTWLLRDAFNARLLALALWRPTWAATVTFVVCLAWVHWDVDTLIVPSRFTWLLAIPFALLIYGIALYLAGGVTLAKRTRMKQFLFQR